MTEIEDAIEEGAIRTRIVKELLESLAESRKVMLDLNKDLKTRNAGPSYTTAPARYSTPSSETCK